MRNTFCFKSAGQQRRGGQVTIWKPNHIRVRSLYRVYRSPVQLRVVQHHSTKQPANGVETLWELKKNTGDTELPLIQQTIANFLEFPSIPLGTYVSNHSSALHRLDPRLKQAWLATMLLLPQRGSLAEKSTVCLVLAFSTAAALPYRVWRPQLSVVTKVCSLIFFIAVLGSESVIPLVGPREPSAFYEGLLDIPTFKNCYYNTLFHFGPLQISQRNFSLAMSASCIAFTALQSAQLSLCTTTPEGMIWALRWYLKPLLLIGVPVDGIVFTLLFSMRFTTTVFDEIRNICLGLVSRRIEWHGLNLTTCVALFGSILLQTLNTLFLTSAAVSEALCARGFDSSSGHEFSNSLSASPSRAFDCTALLALSTFVTYFLKF